MKKRRMIIVYLLLIILILIFPEKVFAYESTICKMYYYDLDMSSDGIGEPELLQEDFEFIGDFSSEAMAFVIYTNLFEKEDVRFLPETAEFISVTIVGDTLLLNVSKGINEIRGGAAQAYLLRQLSENAKQFGVNHFTLMIEGQAEYLSEGIISDKIVLR